MNKSTLTNKSIHFFSQYFINILTVIVVFITIRLLEFFYFNINNIIPKAWQHFVTALNMDMFFIVICSVLFVIPLFIFYLFKKSIALKTMKIIWLIIILINLSLTHYFLSSNELLTYKLFEFSLKEIFVIISSEFVFERLLFWLADIVILWFAYLIFFRIHKKIILKQAIKIGLSVLYFFLLIPILINIQHYKKELKHFTRIEEFFLANNKITILTESIIDHRSNVNKFNLTEEELDLAIQEFHKLNPKFEYTSKKYPLLHKKGDYNPLGKYFTKKDVKPNIVIIITESLSRSFSGPNAKFGSLTPFLDSLANEGLYWSNFLSNCERSYGALPNILGSLPYGKTERGIINDSADYPKHETLISILKKENYYSRFFYGGWSHFDKMDDFLKYQKIDEIIEKWHFQEQKFNVGKQSWGFNDKFLFEKAFDTMEANEKEKYISVFFTLNIHTPYNLCEKEYYKDEFLETRLQKLKINPDSAYKNFTEKGIISSILFTDDALRWFFEKYKKRDDFKNTIFIITGDHDIRVLPINSVLDFYKVPLIIYSPLIIEPARFKSISTHRDILPSLLQLFEQNYNFNFESSNSFIGNGLDTANSIFNNRIIQLNLFNKYYPNIIYNNVLFAQGNTFLIDSLLDIHPIKDSIVQNNILKKYNTISAINKFVTTMDKISK
jgi:phosphoglycerol transferase MdoB-like AlkP superfamily enzyme